MSGAQSAFDALTGFDASTDQAVTTAATPPAARPAVTTGHGQGNLTLAIIGGALGAAAGGVAWVALSTVTSWQLSFFAIVVGGLVGFGVGQGNGGRGGLAAAMIAGVFALAGIVGAQGALTYFALEDAKKHTAHITDEEAMDHMSWGVYEELQSKGVVMTTNADGWPAQVLAETSQRWKGMSTADKRAYRASMRGTIDSGKQEAPLLSYAVAYLWSSGWFGLVCVGLSVITAWRIASRDVMQEAAKRGAVPKGAPAMVQASAPAAAGAAGFRGLPPAAESAKPGGGSMRMGVPSEEQTMTRSTLATLGKSPAKKESGGHASEAA